MEEVQGGDCCYICCRGGKRIGRTMEREGSGGGIRMTETPNRIVGPHREMW